MKITKVLPHWALGLTLLFGTQFPLSAADVFRENFDDSPPYTENSAPPSGLREIHFGQWVNEGKNKLPGRVTSVKSLSAPMSLELRLEKANADCRVMGWFGKTNTETKPVSDELVVRLAFFITEPGPGVSFGIRNENHQSAGLVEVDEGGSLRASFLGERVEVAPRLEGNQWYNLEFIFSADQKTYTVDLYAEDGTTLLGSQRGGLARRDGAEGGLAYFIVVQETPGASVFVDNITATTGSTD